MSDSKKHIDDNATAQYIDWLRNQGEKPDQDVVDHVSECESCRLEIMELADVLDHEDRKVNSSSKSNTLVLIIRAAAVLAAVLVVALAIQFLRNDPNEVTIVEDTSDSTEIMMQDSIEEHPEVVEEGSEGRVEIVIQHDTIQYAANFEINPALEILYKAHFRSTKPNLETNYRTENTYFQGDTLSLDFSSEQESKLSVSLLSNTGKEISQLDAIEGKITLQLKYAPGLYYLKLVTSDELLLVGKLKIFSKTD